MVVVVVVVMGGGTVLLTGGGGGGGAELDGAEIPGDGSDTDGDVVTDGAPSDGGVVEFSDGAAESDGDVAVVSEVIVVSDVVVDSDVVASITGTGSQVNGDEGSTGNGSPGGRVAAGFCSTTLYVNAFHCSTSCCFCSTWPTSWTVVLTATSLSCASCH